MSAVGQSVTTSPPSKRAKLASLPASPLSVNQNGSTANFSQVSFAFGLGSFRFGNIEHCFSCLARVR